jgi:hypothetical protein
METRLGYLLGCASAPEMVNSWALQLDSLSVILLDCWRVQTSERLSAQMSEYCSAKMLDY